MHKNFPKTNLFLLLLSFVITSAVYSQDTTKTEKEYMGVAVSPTTLRFNVKPGNSQTKTVKITNDTKNTKKFNLSFQEFMADASGKSISVKTGSSKHGLSKWLNITPSYVELKSGEQKSITVQLEVPNSDSAAIAGWTILTIDEVRDRVPLEVGNATKNTLAMGIYPGIGFGVYIYQNPPNVNNLNVEITSFIFQEKDKKRTLLLKCKNNGDGIGYCSEYVDLLNLTTGEQIKIPAMQFTILPGFNREFTIALPPLSPGKYSAAGVIDFGSKEYVQTAELEFSIQ